VLRVAAGGVVRDLDSSVLHLTGETAQGLGGGLGGARARSGSRFTSEDLVSTTGGVRRAITGSVGVVFAGGTCGGGADPGVSGAVSGRFLVSRAPFIYHVCASMPCVAGVIVVVLVGAVKGGAFSPKCAFLLRKVY